MRALRHDKAVRGAVGLLVGFGLLAIVFMQLPARLTAPGGHTITAVFADAQTLGKGDPVRVRGVQVGEVSQITTDPGGRSATVRMSVSDDALPLYADAHATSRWRSLFGAGFVVDLDPGTPGRSKLATRALGLAQTNTQVLLEDVTSVLSGRPGNGLRHMLTELPRTLQDPAVPDAALQAMADTAPPIEKGFGAVRGQRDGDLARLVHDTAQTVSALNAPDDAARALVEGAARTFAVTAHRRGEIRESLISAHAVLPRVRRTAQRLGKTLTLADPLLDRFDDSAAPLAPAATRLRTTLIHARRLLDDAQPLLAQLRPAASSLAAASQAGGPLLEDIKPSVLRLANKILPGLAEKSPESGHTGYEMIGPAVAGLDGAFASFDKSNNFLRFTASLSETSFDSLPCRTALTDPTAEERISCEALFAALGRVLKPAGAK
ncbi:MAG: Mammalian cell entry related domain protein [Conexibacter sp.]|nr:Mammalian cell entry related domain protein [Conexibacter sp.]